MDEDTFYKTDVESLAQGEISPLDIGIDLKKYELIEKMVARKISQKGPLETVRRFFRLLTST